MSQDNTVNVDVKLGVNKFNVDEGHPHIILAEHPDLNEFRKLLKACPAGQSSILRHIWMNRCPWNGCVMHWAQEKQCSVPR